MPAGKRAVVRKIRPIAGLVFDCDGVLFDTRDVNRFYYNHILEELGLAPMTPKKRYAFMHTVDAALPGSYRKSSCPGVGDFGTYDL